MSGRDRVVEKEMSRRDRVGEKEMSGRDRVEKEMKPKHVHFPKEKLVNKVILYPVDDWESMCKKICGFIGCTSPCQTNTTLCYKHILLFQDSELVEIYKPYIQSPEGAYECTTIDCHDPVFKKGYCFAHSYSIRCMYPGCDSRSKTRNRCKNHMEWSSCTVAGCRSTALVADTYCTYHAKLLYNIDVKLYEIYQKNEAKRATMRERRKKLRNVHSHTHVLATT